MRKKRTNGVGHRTALKTTIVAGVFGLVAAIVAIGPDRFIQSVGAAVGIYPAPIIVRVLPATKEDGPVGTFLVTVTNPSDDPVAITGYDVEPSSIQPAGALATGEAPKVKSKDWPEPCLTGQRSRRFGSSLVIGPKEILDVTIRPWTSDEMCNYDLVLNSTHGNSDSVQVQVWQTGGLPIKSISKEEWDRLRKLLPPPVEGR